MTDRIQSLTVFLTGPLRDDEPVLENIELAVAMIAGVSRVERGPVRDHSQYLARLTADSEWRKKILDLLEIPDRGVGDQE